MDSVNEDGLVFERLYRAAAIAEILLQEHIRDKAGSFAGRSEELAKVYEDRIQQIINSWNIHPELFESIVEPRIKY